MSTRQEQRVNRLTIVIVSLFVLLMTTNSVWAFFGSSKTKTESGNAKMELPEYKGVKHAIGVMQFTNESGWRGEWKLGGNLTMMLESALYDSGRFVVVERENLGNVIVEQDLAASGRTAPAKKVAQTGKIRSARYLAKGAVMELEDGTSGGDAGVGIGGVRVGGGKKSAHISLIVTLVDTTTGAVIAKERIVGKASSTALKLGVSLGGVDTDLGGFKKTPLGQAAQECVDQAVVFIAQKMNEIPKEGSVIKATSKGVIINRGSTFGVEAGQMLIMQEEGEELLDPDTGEILGVEDGKVIGKMKVTTVNEKFSYCDVVEGEKEPKPSTAVIFVDKKK